MQEVRGWRRTEVPRYEEGTGIAGSDEGSPLSWLFGETGQNRGGSEWAGSGVNMLQHVCHLVARVSTPRKGGGRTTHEVAPD